MKLIHKNYFFYTAFILGLLQGLHPFNKISTYDSYHSYQELNFLVLFFILCANILALYRVFRFMEQGETASFCAKQISGFYIISICMMTFHYFSSLSDAWAGGIFFYPGFIIIFIFTAVAGSIKRHQATVLSILMICVGIFLYFVYAFIISIFIGFLGLFLYITSF